MNSLYNQVTVGNWRVLYLLGFFQPITKSSSSWKGDKIKLFSLRFVVSCENMLRSAVKTGFPAHYLGATLTHPRLTGTEQLTKEEMTRLTGRYYVSRRLTMPGQGGPLFHTSQWRQSIWVIRDGIFYQHRVTNNQSHSFTSSTLLTEPRPQRCGLTATYEYLVVITARNMFLSSFLHI